MSGVASSIDADLENIQRLARFTGLLPKGLFVDNIVKEMKVGRSVERRRTLLSSPPTPVVDPLSPQCAVVSSLGRLGAVCLFVCGRARRWSCAPSATT
jgi:hypothetical protein